MKKNGLISFAIVAFLLMPSCSKDDEDVVALSSAQVNAQNTFHGTFVYKWEFLNEETKITFLEQYNPPLTIFRDGEKEPYIHGKYRVDYYDGSSYIRYYHIGLNADWISTSPSTDWNVTHVEDLQIVSKNEFKLKEKNSYVWSTYKKSN